jgi:hypothetical protein
MSAAERSKDSLSGLLYSILSIMSRYAGPPASTVAGSLLFKMARDRFSVISTVADEIKEEHPLSNIVHKITKTGTTKKMIHNCLKLLLFLKENIKAYHPSLIFLSDSLLKTIYILH